MVEVDVIIVGMGPTGATLAGLLGQRGVRVAVLDRLPDLFPLPRAAGLDHEVMRIMQELGIAERLASHIEPYRPSEYRGMEGQLIQRLDSTPPPFRLGWAPNYVFEQPAFERAIRTRLAELPNVQAECNAEVVAVGQEADHAWADVKLPGHDLIEHYVGRYLVACDGGSSPIRKQLGIKLEDLGFDKPWLVVDAIVSDQKLAELPQTQVQYCEAARPATYVVGVGKHRRWEVMLLPGDSLSAEFPSEELWPLLERWLKPGEGEIWRAAAYRFHGLVANEWRRDRILLAGDAVHMTPPFMAQGMVQGLRDALNLAWKLERVLTNTSSDQLLDSYQIERRPHVVATTGTAMQLGRLICERDPYRANERDARLLACQGGKVTTRFRQDLIPGLRAGVIEVNSPGAGAILPQPQVQTANGLERLDDLTQCRFRVVALGPLSQDERDVLVAALPELEGRLVEIGHVDSRRDGSFQVVEFQPVLEPWLSELGQRFAVVRPDHYVHGTATSVERTVDLLRSLEAQLA